MIGSFHGKDYHKDAVEEPLETAILILNRHILVFIGI